MMRRHGMVALLVLAATTARAQDSAYRVLNRITIGGEGGWDYLVVDSAARRLYVSHSTHVVVVDLESRAVVGDIPNTAGVHGIALAPSLGRGYTSNGRDSSLTIFDLKTLAPIGSVAGTGRNPDAILYDAISGRVFAFNGGSASATVVDAASGTIVGTVPLGGKPEAGVADGQGNIFVNIEDSSALVKFDARTLTVLARWPLAPCEEPTGLALDRAHHRLFAGCSNRLMAVVDATNGRVITTLPIGGGVDGAAFDAATGLAFSTNGEGTLTVVHEDSPDSFRVVATVSTQRGARTIALDPRTHRIYTTTAEFGPAPAPTPERPRPRPPIIPGSVVVLELGR